MYKTCLYNYLFSSPVVESIWRPSMYQTTYRRPIGRSVEVLGAFHSNKWADCYRCKKMCRLPMHYVQVCTVANMGGLKLSDSWWRLSKILSFVHINIYDSWSKYDSPYNHDSRANQTLIVTPTIVSQVF